MSEATDTLTPLEDLPRATPSNPLNFDELTAIHCGIVGV